MNSSEYAESITRSKSEGKVQRLREYESEEKIHKGGEGRNHAVCSLRSMTAHPGGASLLVGGASKCVRRTASQVALSASVSAKQRISESSWNVSLKLRSMRQGSSSMSIDDERVMVEEEEETVGAFTSSTVTTLARSISTYAFFVTSE